MTIKRTLSLLLSVLLITMLSMTCTSCGGKKEAESPIAEVKYRDSYVYTSFCVDFSYKDESTYVYNVIDYNDEYYVILEKYPIDGSASRCFLCRVSSEGEIISEVELNDINVYVASDIINDNLMYVTYNGKLQSVNIYTGEFVSSEQFDSDLCGVYRCKDGYVILAIGHVYKYNLEGELIGTASDETWNYYNGYRPYYEDGDKCYLLSDSGFGWKYYELDFNNGTGKLIYDPAADRGMPLGCSGKYVFDNTGLYSLDFVDSCMYPLTFWNNMDLQPPVYTYSEPIYIGIDDEKFIQLYRYENGISQMVVYTYDPDESYDDRATLVVGGYNCRYDLLLLNAIYNYNTSQSDYRVVIDEYNDEYSFDSYEGGGAAIASLIQRFNDGGAPDVFYGDSFDYEGFAESGMTLDISDYMSLLLNERIESITPSIRSLMFDNNGSCYRLFSAYQMDGYYSSVVDKYDLTVPDIQQLMDDPDLRLTSMPYITDIAQSAILNPLKAYGVFSVDEYESLLDYVFSYGYPETTAVSSFELDKTTVDECLLWNYCLYSVMELYEFELDSQATFSWVGRPSLYSSQHVIVPYGEVAVSASTEHPEACCDFIAFLLDEDVQDLANLSCFIPVEDDTMRKMLGYATDHSVIPDSDFSYYMYLGNYHEVSEETCDRFLSYIDLADTVRFYDWGISAIIYEEISSYYNEGKPISEIAESLQSRIAIYTAEN